MSSNWWLDKGWYLAWWAGVFIAARVFLVNPIVKELRKRTLGGGG